MAAITIWKKGQKKTTSLTRGLYRFYFNFGAPVIAKRVAPILVKFKGMTLPLEKRVLVKDVFVDGKSLVVEIDVQQNPIGFLIVAGALVAMLGVGWFFLDKVERVVLLPSVDIGKVGLVVLGFLGLLGALRLK